MWKKWKRSQKCKRSQRWKAGSGTWPKLAFQFSHAFVLLFLGNNNLFAANANALPPNALPPNVNVLRPPNSNALLPNKRKLKKEEKKRNDARKGRSMEEALEGLLESN
jgi:hypothetical protein